MDQNCYLPEISANIFFSNANIFVIKHLNFTFQAAFVVVASLTVAF
jgi:hypothetical protein